MSEGAPITIHFLGAPVPLMQSVRLHLEAVTREFQLIEFAADDASSPPARLLELTSRMRKQYDRFGFATSRLELTAALDRGTDTIDLELVVPRAAGGAAQLFLAAMDETDEWCERGELLTLASPPEQRALRRWFFAEIERQVAGQPPRPWSEFEDPGLTR
ncbi:MAG: hypothetical protein QOF40_292 [Actinomycetota bacterium]|nr:hypothetical protein [Actinomycetota bacterium]